MKGERLYSMSVSFSGQFCFSWLPGFWVFLKGFSIMWFLGAASVAQKSEKNGQLLILQLYVCPCTCRIAGQYCTLKYSHQPKHKVCF